MKVILLAAGRGSRLGERTKDRPKCLCTLCGRTLLERCLDSLEQAGISRERIGVVTGYRSGLLQVEGATQFHNPDWAETNMFVSLTKASLWLEREPCIVCYSDVVFSPEVIRRLAECRETLTIPYYTGYWALWARRMENPLEDLETFRVTAEGNLLEIGKKPERRADIQGQFMGIIRFTPESWAQVQDTIRHTLPKPVEKLDMTTLLNAMVEQGHPVSAFPTDSLWLECDTQEDIELYEREFASELG